MSLIIAKTSVWGDSYKARNPFTYKRLKEKCALLHGEYRYPYFDHPDTYAYKPAGQRGPAHENQTFVLGFAYKVADSTIIDKLRILNLGYYSEECIFRGKPAFKYYIFELDLPIAEIVSKTAHITDH